MLEIFYLMKEVKMIEQLESRKLLSYAIGRFEVGSTQESIVSADWNHNGSVGIATSSYSSQTVSIGYKTSLNSFRFIWKTIKFNVGIDHINVIDINQDNLPDLVVSSFEGNSFAIVKNLGNSTFDTPIWYTSNGINSTTVGDFNRDNKMDLVVGKSYDTGLSVYFGNNGDLDGPYDFVTSNILNSAFIADVAGGNGRDIVSVDFKSNNLTIYQYVGEHSFAEIGSYFCGKGPADVIVADISGDASNEIVTANYFDNTVSVFNSSMSKQVYSTNISSNPTSLSAGDYDGDGDTDLSVAGAGNDTLMRFSHQALDMYPLIVDSLAKSISISWNPLAKDSPIPRRIFSSKLNIDNKDEILIANEGASYCSIYYFTNLVKLGPYRQFSFKEINL